MSFTTVSLRLPWPPSLNRYYRHVGVRTLLSAPGRLYRRQVADEVLVQWPAGLPRPLAGRLRLWVQVFPPDQRLRDLDNLVKGLQDAMQHALVYADDGQIDDLRITRRVSYGRPGYVALQIETM